MIAEIYDKKSGICGGKGGSMHVADLDLGDQQRLVLSEKIAQLGKPVRVIWGEKDRIIPASHAALAGADVHILPNAWHMVQMEAAHEVNKMLHF
jgi:pyruvate dehydrogenase E2 component (dihydrolipoamide acetyltransferase)